MALSKTAVRLIHKAIEKLFDKTKARTLSRKYLPKQLILGYHPQKLTIDGIFNSASKEAGVTPDEDIESAVAKNVEAFLDAEKARTKGHVVKAVEGWLRSAESAGVDTDLETVLNGELAQVWGRATSNLKRIIETESTHARNTGSMDGILKINAYNDISDPIVYFVVVHDKALCKECKRLHLMSDGVTPKLWLMSEVKQGYHLKTDNVPSIGGEHPHCRCTVVTLLPEYGFDESGAVQYMGTDHDEMKKQRG